MVGGLSFLPHFAVGGDKGKPLAVVVRGLFGAVVIGSVSRSLPMRGVNHPAG